MLLVERNKDLILREFGLPWEVLETIGIDDLEKVAQDSLAKLEVVMEVLSERYKRGGLELIQKEALSLRRGLGPLIALS